jgi:hypothetical protein
MATTPRSEGEEGVVSPAELEAHRHNDITLDYMLKQGIPVTRERYIYLNHGGKPPKRWTQEHEAELPGPLQDANKVTD